VIVSITTRRAAKRGRAHARTAGGRAGLALIAVLALGLLAGCGGGGDEAADTDAVAETSSEPTVAISRDQVISEGDAICAEVNAAIAGLAASSATPTIIYSQQADLYSGMVERLRGLEGDDAELTEVFAAGRDLIAAADEAEAAAESGDATATASAEAEVESALADFNEAAADYGFTECGGEASTSVEPGSVDGTDTGEASGVEGDGTVEPAPEDGGEVVPAEPSGGAPADGGAPTDGGDTGGGTDGGTGTGAGGGSDGGSGSTGGFSPG